MANTASPLISPSSDKRFWSALHERVDTLLENRRSDLVPSFSATNDGGSNPAKKSKADSMLLIRGFDSVAFSLSQLTSNIEKALQGARELGKQTTSSEIIHSNSIENVETEEDKEQGKSEKKGVKRKLDDKDCSDNDKDNEGGNEVTAENKKKQKLKNVKKLTEAMTTKSTSLAKELNTVKSDMCFLQERCALLEEENQRLRDGFGKADRPDDDDDLMRLQLEALLAEKSRLATENANLTRENQCLRQLVEYHQFATEDLSASYEQVIQGINLDFSSAVASDEENLGDPETPRSSRAVFEFPTCIAESYAGEPELLKD